MSDAEPFVAAVPIWDTMNFDDAELDQLEALLRDQDWRYARAGTKTAPK